MLSNSVTLAVRARGFVAAAATTGVVLGGSSGRSAVDDVDGGCNGEAGQARQQLADTFQAFGRAAFGHVDGNVDDYGLLLLRRGGAILRRGGFGRHGRIVARCRRGIGDWTKSGWKEAEKASWCCVGGTCYCSRLDAL